ncbi:hypothetical protein [Candidatus Parabeggiatoa sp. HSG14]|uniref:hypothetical protein n=1 Tax=Candidatus Parabeggiatoa sp. HSG14 TaxID=3055593 RepID=UPI0025A746EF|nr:hypothetical protein [Thiotrichales bacterium HSG14]
MLQTFKATLKGNQIEWADEMPITTFDKPMSVYVTLLDSEQETTYKANKTTLAALKEIESGGGKVFENVEELFKDLDN